MVSVPSLASAFQVLPDAPSNPTECPGDRKDHQANPRSDNKITVSTKERPTHQMKALQVEGKVRDQYPIFW